MAEKQETLFRSALRSMLNAFFKGIGFFLILVPFILMIAGIGALKDEIPKKDFQQKVIPNAEGKREMMSSSKPTILQIDIEGIIGTEKLNAENVRGMLVQSREGDLDGGLVKGIFLMINTPGGTVIDSDGIYRALKAYQEQYDVPVYAYVDGLCASGGMYVASAADKIYASDVSLIGSVGVILSTFPNVSEALKSIGVTTVTVSAGKGKDALNPFRTWQPGEAENYDMLTDYYYQQFVNLVTENRPSVSKDALINTYGAKIFPAPLGREIGLVDETGATRKSALTALVKELGIENNYQVVSLQKENWFETLFDSRSPLFTGKIEHSFQCGTSIPPELYNKFLYLDPALL